MTSTGTKMRHATVSANMPPARYEIKGCYYRKEYCRVFDLKNS